MDGVVMLVNEFPPLPVGGAERQAERLSAYLTQLGWPIWVITRQAVDLPASETRHGFQIIRPSLFGRGKILTLTFVLGSLWTLFQLRRHYRILHAHLAFGPAFAAVLAGRLLGKKVLVKLGNSGEFGDIKVSQRTLRGRIRLSVFRRWADAIIVLDEGMKQEALAAGFDSSRMHRMDNGIDAQKFTPRIPRSQAQHNLGLDDKVVVIFIGRLAPQKALPMLLDGFAQALPECPTLHLLVLGDGPERLTLENQTQSLGLENHVSFVGNRDDVRPYLEAADIFALPSAIEGISNALLEAMSTKLACLVTAVGGNPDVLDGGRCGLLLPVGDREAWGRALAELGNDSQRREQLGEAARHRILERFDFSVVGDQYEALYHQLLGEGLTGNQVRSMV